jgi:class 3 adenylate cyclase
MAHAVVMKCDTGGMDIPEVHYARAGGVAVAYQVVGDGPQTLVFAPPTTNLYSLWELPRVESFFRRLAGDARVVVFDARGTGLSDRGRSIALESRMDDLNAVLDASGCPRAAIFGADTSANVCALFAATYPERCERLALYRPHARTVRSASYPYGMPEEEGLEWMREVRESWGERGFLEDFARHLFEPELAENEEFLAWFVRERRLAASPEAAADFARMSMETDITDVLGSIRVPTLVLHPKGDAWRDESRYVADRIPQADVVALGGAGRWVYADDVADALLSFLRGEAMPLVPDSVLATVLFTDLVSSTERAVELGDRGWRDVLERHHARVRSELRRYRGTEVDSAGDGFFCRFDGPARAIACARRIVEGANELGVEVRVGIHTGECELVGEKIAGVSVVTGSRISSLAAPGEVLVSSTVKDLVAGSGFTFEDRGEHALKGVPGVWRLYAVANGSRN